MELSSVNYKIGSQYVANDTRKDLKKALKKFSKDTTKEEVNNLMTLLTRYTSEVESIHKCNKTISSKMIVELKASFNIIADYYYGHIDFRTLWIRMSYFS